jgi:hypothetical protein
VQWRTKYALQKLSKGYALQLSVVYQRIMYLYVIFVFNEIIILRMMKKREDILYHLLQILGQSVT